MHAHDRERAVDLLVEARVRGIQIDELPRECVPASLEEAYDIQAGVAARCGPVAGYKAGATRAGVPPRGAPVFRDITYPSPAEIAVAIPVEVEAEIAFSFGTDLPPRPGGYSDAEVFDAVTTVNAAIEVAGSRYREVTKAGPLAKLADNGSNVAVVLGLGREDWRLLDVLRTPVRLFCNGEEVAAALGRADGLDPKVNLPWLVNVYAPRYGGIRRGGFAITGSLTGLTAASPGDIFVAKFDDLGQVEVTFRHEFIAN